MIGTLREGPSTIVGGGVAGMLLAYELLKRGHPVTLLEKSDRLGGLIRTTQTDYGIAEWAAHSLLASQEVRHFFEELNVPLTSLNPGSTGRYLVRNGRPRLIPLSPKEIVGLLWRLFTAKASAHSEPTLEEWALTYLGESALNYLVNPFVTGIYGCSPRELLVSMAFPKFHVGENQTFMSHMKTLPKRKSRAIMAAPTHGMESLIKSLEEKIRSYSHFQLKLNHDVNDLHSLEKTSSNVILSAPLDSLSKLFSSTHPELSRSAKQVPYAPLVSVNVFYRSSSFPKAPKGVGVLIPEVEHSESLQVLGVLFNSSSFKGRTHDSTYQSFTVMLGGTRTPQALEWTDSQISEKITQAFATLFNVKQDFEALEIHRHPKAVPVYGPALQHFQMLARRTWCSSPGHVLFGNYTGQVSIRGMIETVLTLPKQG